MKYDNLNKTEAEIRTKLDDLILYRFKDIKELKEKLKIIFQQFQIEIAEKEELPEDEPIGDYWLIGTIKNKNIYFDFDIWYLIDRQGNLLITETAGETQ